MAKKKYYETDDFKKLQAKWYKKLGSDIQPESSETLIEPEIFKTQKSQYEGGLDHYQFCQAVLREYNFKKDLHKVIFEKYAEGFSERKTTDWLIQVHGLEIDQRTIGRIVKRIKDDYITGRNLK